jgi:hypothetical protein
MTRTRTVLDVRTGTGRWGMKFGKLLISGVPRCTKVVLITAIADTFPESLVRAQDDYWNGADRLGVRC